MKHFTLAFLIMLGMTQVMLAQSGETNKGTELPVIKVVIEQTEEANKGTALPVINVKAMDGRQLSTESFKNNGNPIILSFWATWCKPCIKELNAISEVYEDWQEETGVKLIAVSIDDTRASARVKPLVDGSGWDYEVYLDVNQEFKRAMNVNNVPHTFILNGRGEVVWQTAAFVDGGEAHLIEIVRKVKAGEPVSDHE